MSEAGSVDVASSIAEQIRHSLSGQALLESPFLQKEGTSQLALLTDEAYAAGLRRIETAIGKAEAAGKTLTFPVDISLSMTVGRAPDRECRGT